MKTFKISDKKTLEQDKIWSLANDGNFQIIIDHLLETGIPDEDIGEVLFKIADQAIEEKQFNSAIAILKFLVNALEDQSEAPPLIKKIGDIYIQISAFDNAREYYGKLPLTLDNIKLCLGIFALTFDIEGLLSLRDTVLGRVNQKNQEKTHSFTNEIILKIYSTPQTLNAHVDLYTNNITDLKKLYPFSQGVGKYNDMFSIDPSKISQIDTIKICDNFYAKQGDIWSKSFSLNSIRKEKIEQNGSDIMIYCDSLQSFSTLIDLIKTDNPEFIKKECRIIIDFKILMQAIKVINLSPLVDCDFIVRFIDKNDLKTQLEHLLLERKLPFAERAIYLSEKDSDFFSQYVTPILSACEKKILHKIDQYEQLYPELFPEDYQDKVLKKIKAGQKLNILLCTSMYTTYLQHSTRDISTGFQQLGHNTFIQIEDADAGMGNRKDVTIENLINFKPDIIFAINHLRYSTFEWFPKSIPFVTWVQDLMPHILSLQDPSLITDRDYIFSFSQHWIDHFFKNHSALKKKRIYCLPITVNTDIYRPLKTCPKKYDITFISHLPHPSETYLPILKGEKTPEITSELILTFLTRLIDELDTKSWVQLFQIQSDPNYRINFIKKICQNIGITFDKTFSMLTDPRDNTNAPSRFMKHVFLLTKTKPISTLLSKGFRVRVFGKNWDSLPEFKSIAMGPVKNGEDLNKVINESRINLNMSPGTSYHMKAPEVIAARSFMLTRRLPKEQDTMPIVDFFKENKEIIFFENEYDLIQKASIFLKNKEKREQIAESAYNKFLTSYGIEKAAQSILEKMTMSSIQDEN